MTIIKDISEDIPYDLAVVPGTSSNYQLSDISFDIAVNNMPFFIAATDEQPYRRESAPSKREQIDQTTEPGEQSFTGWWFRSQSSFHLGAGGKFFEPSQDETLRYRFWESEGVDVWTKGEVSLLRDAIQTHEVTGAIAANGRPQQESHTIRWDGVDAVLMRDEYDVDKVFQPRTATITNKALTSNVATLTTSVAHNLQVGMQAIITGVDATFNGEYRITAITSNTFSYAKTAADVTSTAATGSVQCNIIHFIDYNSGSAEPVFAICTDGTSAYWVTNAVQGGANKLHVYKKSLSADSTTAETLMFSATGLVVINATMSFVKERIVMAVNNSVYEFSSSATSLPTALFTHASSDYQFTSIAASGPAIYISGFRAQQSSIIKFTLSSAGVMPTLTFAVVAAEFPAGEQVYKMYYYLGYLMIGTNKGIRVASISPDDGSITSGPLVFEAIDQPCYDFAAQDRFVWCATGVNNTPGLIRIDLSEQIAPLRFAYANDVAYEGVANHNTTSCAFIGETDQIFFTSAANSLGYGYCESPTVLVPNGYLRTGFIRYATIESKYFKFLKVRGNLDNGSIGVSSVTNKEVETFLYDITAQTTNLDLGIARPTGAQEYLAFKFTLNRNSVDTTTGSIMSGYQIKALPAIEKQRLIQFPLYCYDVEMDKYNNIVGSEDDRAFDRISELESIEKTGNVVTIQDFRTNETYSALIEEIRFYSATPPSERFNGFGGKLLLLVRKL